jgi:hypothetical protein
LVFGAAVAVGETVADPEAILSSPHFEKVAISLVLSSQQLWIPGTNFRQLVLQSALRQLLAVAEEPTHEAAMPLRQVAESLLPPLDWRETRTWRSEMGELSVVDAEARVVRVRRVVRARVGECILS